MMGHFCVPIDTWQRNYNEVLPHSALGGQTSASIMLPPCSPASRPLRVASGDGLRPALTQAARDGRDEGGRDRETSIDRTEKHRHDRSGTTLGLYFCLEGSWGSGHTHIDRRGLRRMDTAHRLPAAEAQPWMRVTLG